MLRRGLAALVVATGLQPPPAAALVFVVNHTADIVDHDPGNGICETASGGGVCTLRAAIQEASAAGGSHVVRLAPGTYVLSRPAADPDTPCCLAGLSGAGLYVRPPDGGELSLAIEGAGAERTIIDGNRAVTDSRVFTVAGATASIARVTIRNGVAHGPPTRPMQFAQHGGGIVVYEGSRVTLRQVVLRDNLAGVLGTTLGGGAIANFGTLQLDDVTIEGNQSDVLGGGILNRAPGTLTMTGGALIDNDRDGIANVVGTVTLTNVTLSGNDLFNGGGSTTLVNVTLSEGGIRNDSGFVPPGLVVPPGVVSLARSLVATSRGTNCIGPITSLGLNLDSGDGACGYTPGLGDLKYTDPLLGPLADNGGASPTYALLPGSPAIDAAGDVDCPATDQRGFPRPVDGDDDGGAACDVGAFERQPTTRLSVGREGSGGGWVTSEPAGVECGEDCLGIYPRGQLVTLAAEADEGSAFTGWGGACAGLGPCAVTVDTDTVVMATFVQVTTTTIPAAGEDCGNCIDDDGDGLTDYESPRCCGSANALAIARSRLRAGRGVRTGRLRLEAGLPASAWVAVNPRRDEVTLQLRSGNGTLFCAVLAPARWKNHGRGFRYGDRAQGLRSVVLGRMRNGRVPLRVAGRMLDLRPFIGPSLTATIGTGGQCARATIALEPKGGGVVYP